MEVATFWQTKMRDGQNLIQQYTTRCPKEEYSGLTRNNFQTGKAITLQSLALEGGKPNLDFDMLQLYLT